MRDELTEPTHSYPGLRSRVRSSGSGVYLALVSSLSALGCGDQFLAVLPEGTVECQEASLSLAVGEWAALPAAQSICLLFAPADARYAIAYFDTRLVAKARRGVEQPWPEPHWFDIKVGEGELPDAVAAPESGGAASLRAPPALPTPPATACPEAAPDEILCRPRPWAVADEFLVYSDLVHFLADFAGQTAHVIGLNGHLVFAVLERDLTRFLDCEWCQVLVDSVGQVVNDDAMPLIRSVFTNTLPVTSPASGQLLVLLHAREESQSVGWISDPQFHVLLQISLSFDLDKPETGRSLLLVHELTHAFQRQYAWERGFVFSDEWAREGGADLMASDFLRRRAGISLAGNFDAAGAIDLQTWREDPERFWYARSFQHSGEIATGYQHAANLLRDFVLRRYQTGEPDTLAMRAVLRGALEGWYGAATPDAADGLTNRMKQRLGENWDPVEAVLTWTLSNAVDDRAASPQFHNPAVLEAWNPESPGVSWLSDGTLELGSRNAVSLRRKIGSTGYLIVEDADIGGLLVLRSVSTIRMPFGVTTPGVRWAIVRFE